MAGRAGCLSRKIRAKNNGSDSCRDIEILHARISVANGSRFCNGRFMAKRKTSASKKGSKPSAKQLAARRKFAAAAKARSKKSSNSRPKAIKAPAQNVTVKGFKLKRKAPLKPRASGRRRPSGPDSRQDDVSKVAVRVPTLVLAPLKDTTQELDFSGWSNMAW
jgi:hypothetical protein